VKKPLALPNAECLSVLLAYMVLQKFTIPHRLLKPKIKWRPAKVSADSIDVLITKSVRSSASILLSKSGKPVLIKAPDPVLDSTNATTKHTTDLFAGHAAARQQNTVELIVVPSFLRSNDFLLNCYLHYIAVLYVELLHVNSSYSKYRRKPHLFAIIYVAMYIKHVAFVVTDSALTCYEYEAGTVRSLNSVMVLPAKNSLSPASFKPTITFTTRNSVAITLSQNHASVHRVEAFTISGKRLGGTLTQKAPGLFSYTLPAISRGQVLLFRIQSGKNTETIRTIAQ
jgi:hypothetical protein